MNNAIEIDTFERLFKQEGKAMKFEYVAYDTPQQNERVERKFEMLYNRLHAMLDNRTFHVF